MTKHTSWFIVPMAFGRDKTMPVPDAEGASRCERAFRIVNHIAKRAGDRHDDVSIVLGAGMPHRYCEPFGEQTLANLSERWLINRGWRLQVIKNPKGCNTRTELLAIREIVQMRQRDRAGTTHVRIATSWWHAPRTWIVALSVFHKLIRVSCARTTIPSATLAREMFKEACKIPYELLRTIPAFDRLTQNWYDPQYQ